MKKHTLNLASVFVVASLSISSAFAGQMKTGLLENNNITIKQNASNVANVTDVKLTQKGSGIMISGKVVLLSKNRPARHRAIPGHVDISLVDNKGNATKLASVHYNKISIKSRFAKFRYNLADTPKQGSKIVVAHNPNNYN